MSVFLFTCARDQCEHCLRLRPDAEASPSLWERQCALPRTVLFRPPRASTTRGSQATLSPLESLRALLSPSLITLWVIKKKTRELSASSGLQSPKRLHNTTSLHSLCQVECTCLLSLDVSWTSLHTSFGRQGRFPSRFISKASGTLKWFHPS